MSHPANIIKLLQQWHLVAYQEPLRTRLGVEDLARCKVLAWGGKAYVFWLPGNYHQVFKMTVDTMDAGACVIIQKRPDKNLLKVYDVFRFGGKDFYGILVEKLTPLPQTESEIWEEFREVFCEVPDAYDLPEWKGLTKKWLLESKQALPELEGLVGSALVDRFRTCLWQLEIWCDALEDRGILWGDLIDDNLMYRGQRLIISDVGRGRVPGVQIPVLKPQV